DGALIAPKNILHQDGGCTAGAARCNKPWENGETCPSILEKTRREHETRRLRSRGNRPFRLVAVAVLRSKVRGSACNSRCECREGAAGGGAGSKQRGAGKGA